MSLGNAMYVADGTNIKIEPPLCCGVQRCLGGKGNLSAEYTASKKGTLNMLLIHFILVD